MMANQIMRGATRAREYVSTFLSVNLPPLIEAARTVDQYDLADWQLPLPKVYDSYDPLTVSEYPAVGSLVNRTSNWVRYDVNDHAENVYMATYAVQVFVWARTPDNDGVWEVPEYDSALRVRDDILALMRTCILNTPSLGQPGVCLVNEGTLVEDYFDAIKTSEQTSRWMAGGALSFDMQMREANYLPRIGTADRIDVNVKPLHPL